MLQDNGSWLGVPHEATTSSWSAPASSASSPTASSPSTAPSTRSTSSATRPASGTTTSSGRWRSPAATASSSRDAVGRRADRLPRDHRAELPEPVLPLRPRHQPGPRRQPHLPVGVPGQLRAGRDPRAARRRSPRAGAARGRGRRRTPTATRTRSARWCGRTGRCKHSHFKNPEGKVCTLSPWPIPTYWDWTRAVEPDDYVWD